LQRWPVYLIGALALAVVVIAVPNAVSWYGRPVPGVLVGPDAVVSSISSSNWDGATQGLRFPDRIVAVDGRDLSSLKRAEPGRRLGERVCEAFATGRSHVEVVVKRGASTHAVRLAIQPLDASTWWLVAGSVFFAGALYIAAGMIALGVNPVGRLSRTFCALAVASGLFLTTLFDYHTTFRLVPLFYCGYALLPGAVCMLALRLPDDAPVLRRMPWLEQAIVLAGLAVAACLVGTYWFGGPSASLQTVWTSVFGASFVFFVVTFVVRYALARGRRRANLRALLTTMVPPYAVVGIFMALRPLTEWAAHGDELVYPALALAPIATAFAFVRYDLWGSRAVLSRILTKVAVGTVVCVLAIAAGAAFANTLGAPFVWAVVAATAGGIFTVVLVAVAANLSEHVLFPSRAKYKPTVARLSEQLTSITSPEQVARAMERTVRRWLPCDHIQLSLVPGKDERQDPGATGPDSPSQSDENEVRAAASEGASELRLPVTFGATQLGVLEVGEKHGGALFTNDDLDLLGTIVNQGALALAHAQAYQELEQRRKQQAAAWRGEREALVETVAAEISHEIRYPINFFRSIFERANGEALDAEDVDIGREEVERLERLVGGLRRMAAHRIRRRPVALCDLCAHAEVLLRDALAERSIELHGDPRLCVRCDVDQVTQVFVNLLANAMQATEPTDRIGVSWRAEAEGAIVVVWDSGPGFVGDPSALFAPWYTTKSRGTGLGLSITHRLIRAHGWTISASRDSGKTLFTISVRAADIVQTSLAPTYQDTTEVA
jgi:signal transduction histidine kinase